MATQSIFTQTVRHHAGQLLEEAKSLCDSNLFPAASTKFDGEEFGSMLFGYNIEGVNNIPNEMRLQAIREVQQDFKTVWRI